MRPLRLIASFVRVSFQEEAAYRANFGISLISSLLNLITGVLSLTVIFGQVEDVRGWNLPATLALLGVYLIVSALRGLFIGPGLETLAGIDGDIWSGRFDYTLLRPVDTQFLVSFRKWRLFSLFDVALGLGVLGVAVAQLQVTLTLWQALAFVLSLLAGLLILYAILLACAALVFRSPGVLFTWIFDGVFQMARYPVHMYPGWLRLVLTWIVPVGIMTTVPAEMLTGAPNLAVLAAALLFAAALTAGASWLFRRGMRRYTSASS
jgi:ABC-2 type transport system permease protein